MRAPRISDGCSRSALRRSADLAFELKQYEVVVILVRQLPRRRQTGDSTADDRDLHCSPVISANFKTRLLAQHVAEVDVLTNDLAGRKLARHSIPACHHRQRRAEEGR